MSAGASSIPGNANLLHSNTSSPSPESEVTGARVAAAESNIEASPSVLEPHNEFRNLTLLLCLLTAINGGRPRLIDPGAMLSPRKESVIDAVTTILVREHEVIAAAAFKDGTGSIVCESVPGIGPQTVETVTADATPAKHQIALSDFNHSHVVIPYLEEDEREGLNIAAVTNPDEADRCTFPPHLPDGPIIVLGIDSWHEFTINNHTMLKA